MQPCLAVFVLPRQAQVAGNRRFICRGLRGDDRRPAKCGVAGCPNDITRLVSSLDRRIQVVMVVVSHRVLTVAVLGFDEQHAGGELAFRLGAVLGGDLRYSAGCGAAVLVKGDGLGGLGNQPLIGIQIVGALGLGEWLAVLVAELFFPDSAVQRVVAITGNDLCTAVGDLAYLNQAVLGVVAVLGGAAVGLLLGEVACGVVLVARRTALPACATANLREAVVGIVDPSAADFAVRNAVAYRIEREVLGVAAKQATRVGLHLGEAIVSIEAELLCFGGAEVGARVGAAAVVQLLQFAKAVVQVERGLLAWGFDAEVF